MTAQVPSDVLPLTIRLAEVGDENFIYDTWIRSYRAVTEPNLRGNKARRYCERVRARVASVLASGTVYVACNSDDPSQVYGWCAVTRTNAGTVLHYVYVKRCYRQNRVCSRLLAAARVDTCSPCLFLTSCTTPAFDGHYEGRYADVGAGL